MWVQQLNPSSQKLQRKSSRVTSEKILLPIVLIMFVGKDKYFYQDLQTLLKFYNLSFLWKLKLLEKNTSQDQASQSLVKYQPGLILLDLDLFEQQEEGIKTLVSLNNQSKNNTQGSKILVLSSVGDESSIFHTMQAGACGYLLKQNLPAQLHQAITATLNEQVYLCPEVAARFFRGFHCYQENIAQTQPVQASPNLTELNSPNPCNLTNREREVLKLLVEGYRNQEIARCLYITVATVKAHLTTIFEKLEVDSRSRAIVKSLQLGLF